jgi:hypothetical protein
VAFKTIEISTTATSLKNYIFMEENKERNMQNEEQQPDSKENLTSGTNDNIEQQENDQADLQDSETYKPVRDADDQKADESADAETSKSDSLKQQETEAAAEEPSQKEQKPEQEVEHSSGDDEDAEKTDAGDIVHDKDENIYGEVASSEEAEDEEEIDESAYNAMSREELLHALEEAVKEDNLNRIKSRIAIIKISFNQKTKEQKQEDYKRFVEQGAEDESFIEEPDDLEKRFAEVFGVYKQKKADYGKKLEAEKQINLKRKNEILDQLRALINSDEPLKKTYDQFRDLQQEWRSLGMVPRSEVKELWKNYHFLVEKFFDKVKINKELRDLGLRKNMLRKVELCEKAEELLLEDNVNKAFNSLQKYHQKWREIGPVPEDKNDELWDRFRLVTDKIHQRRREHYSQLSEQEEENLKAKQGLLEKAREYAALEGDDYKEWTQTADKMKELFKLWRTIGRVPASNKEKVWKDFKATIDDFFERKKALMAKRKEEQKERYDQKMALIEKAEQLKDSDDWKHTRQEFIALQKQWKEIGPLPRKQADRLWKRFRAACDFFFDRRDEQLTESHAREDENLKLKQALIDELEALEMSGNKDKDLKILQDFQARWAAIGFVPIKKKDAIYKAFRAALDKYFNQLNVSEAEKRAMNFKQKLEDMKDDPNAPRKMDKERGFILSKISRLEEDINLWENNIGFLASTKKSNLLKTEFEKKIEKAKQELAMHKAKLRVLDKVDNEE